MSNVTEYPVVAAGEVDASRSLPGLGSLCAKMAVAHTITYMLMGIIAMTLLDYRQAFLSPTMICWVRNLDDPLVKAGVLFQPLRGVLFALAFYPVRGVIFGKKHGWMVMWWLLVALGILGTFGPAPGSFEGMIFTRIPRQYLGYMEVVPQALLMSAIVGYWVKNAEKKWLNWTLGVLFVITMLLPILGFLAPARQG